MTALHRSGRWARVGALVGFASGATVVAVTLLTSAEPDLEAAVLLAGLASYPTSLALMWLPGIGPYPWDWIAFVVLAPALQFGLLAGIAGALWSLVAKHRDAHSGAA